MLRKLRSNSIGFLFLIPCLAGCASVGTVAEANNHSGVFSYRHQVDRFSGVATDTVRCAFDVSRNTWLPFEKNYRPVDLRVQRILTDDGSENYSLLVTYTGADWQNVGVLPDGQSLSLLLDGQERLQLEGEGSQPILGSYSGAVYESAEYAVTRRQLARIVAAQSVELTLSGDRGLEKGTLEQSSKKRIAGLLALFPR